MPCSISVGRVLLVYQNGTSQSLLKRQKGEEQLSISSTLQSFSSWAGWTPDWSFNSWECARSSCGSHFVELSGLQQKMGWKVPFKELFWWCTGFHKTFKHTCLAISFLFLSSFFSSSLLWISFRISRCCNKCYCNEKVSLVLLQWNCKELIPQIWKASLIAN